jgi:hypothetical protein
VAAWHEGRACVLRVVRHLGMRGIVVSLVRVLMRMRVVVVVVVIRMLICIGITSLSLGQAVSAVALLAVRSAG